MVLNINFFSNLIYLFVILGLNDFNFAQSCRIFLGDQNTIMNEIETEFWSNRYRTSLLGPFCCQISSFSDQSTHQGPVQKNFFLSHFLQVPLNLKQSIIKLGVFDSIGAMSRSFSQLACLPGVLNKEYITWLDWAWPPPNKSNYEFCKLIILPTLSLILRSVLCFYNYSIAADQSST